jgi:predicted transcriptional regulator
MTSQADPNTANAIVRELGYIRRLLILQLLRSGVSQAEIATALGVNQSSVSRMFPQQGPNVKRQTRAASRKS